MTGPAPAEIGSLQDCAESLDKYVLHLADPVCAVDGVMSSDVLHFDLIESLSNASACSDLCSIELDARTIDRVEINFVQEIVDCQQSLR